MSVRKCKNVNDRESWTWNRLDLKLCLKSTLVKIPPIAHPALISRVGCSIWALSSEVRAICWVRRKWRAAPISSTVIIAGWVSRRGVSCGTREGNVVNMSGRSYIAHPYLRAWQFVNIHKQQPCELLIPENTLISSLPLCWWLGGQERSSSRQSGCQHPPVSDARRLQRKDDRKRGAGLNTDARGGGGWRCEPGDMREEQTWFAVLKLLLLVVIHHDVRLRGDQFLLVKLPEVEQGQLIELLEAEQHLNRHMTKGFTGFSTDQVIYLILLKIGFQ